MLDPDSAHACSRCREASVTEAETVAIERRHTRSKCEYKPLDVPVMITGGNVLLENCEMGGRGSDSQAYHALYVTKVRRLLCPLHKLWFRACGPDTVRPQHMAGVSFAAADPTEQLSVPGMAWGFAECNMLRRALYAVQHVRLRSGTPGGCESHNGIVHVEL